MFLNLTVFILDSEITSVEFHFFLDKKVAVLDLLRIHIKVVLAALVLYLLLFSLVDDVSFDCEQTVYDFRVPKFWNFIVLKVREIEEKPTQLHHNREQIVRLGLAMHLKQLEALVIFNDWVVGLLNQDIPVAVEIKVIMRVEEDEEILDA